MNQNKKLFGVTRVPRLGCDYIVESFPSKSKHIILLVKDQMFAVHVYDKDGSRLKVKDIELQFKQCIDLCSKEVQPPISILTAQHRDDWAKDHAHLINLGNKSNFEVIESALFCVALDHRLLGPGYSNFASKFKLTKKMFSMVLMATIVGLINL